MKLPVKFVLSRRMSIIFLDSAALHDEHFRENLLQSGQPNDFMGPLVKNRTEAAINVEID